MNDTDKKCRHLHLTRIANMDLGSFKSDATKGVFRCEECRDIFIVPQIEPYQIKVAYPQAQQSEVSHE